MTVASIFEFEWDKGKAVSNLRKHGVSFEAAATVFLDRFALTVYDPDNSHNEDRWFTLGSDSTGRLLALSHTYRDSGDVITVRIISAREATKREHRAYEEEPR